jgi:catechol 2,3-dioxygenase-like lactoylglutathione lyase family enzyme
MSAITDLFAGVPVSDLDAGIDWYTRFFGRPPDMRAGEEPGKLFKARPYRLGREAAQEVDESRGPATWGERVTDEEYAARPPPAA